MDIIGIIYEKGPVLGTVECKKEDMVPALKGSEWDEIDTSWNVGVGEMNSHS